MKRMLKKAMGGMRVLLRRRPGSYRIWSGQLKGMRIFTSWQDYPRAILGRAESPLCRWIGHNANPGETWVDVGAHHGVTALALSNRVGAAGRVFAFEPALASVGLLARTREENKLKQLTVVPFALGEVGELSMLRVSPQSQGMVGITPKMRSGDWIGEGEVVYEVAFDGIWPRLCGGRDRVDGVKIDVQGAESVVLRGMRESLRKHKPRLVVEYHDYADLPEFLDMLESAGYSRIGRDIDLPEAPATSRLLHSHNYEFPRADR